MAKDWERKLKLELKNDVLKEFEGWSNGDLISHIIDLREEITGLDAQLNTNQTGAGEKGRKEPLTESKYKQTWSYPTKIHFLLELHQKPLTSEDLHGFLSKIDNHYKDYDSPRNNLSVALGRASKSGRIKKIKEPGIMLKYYALPEWMDKEGHLKPAFQSVKLDFLR
jgi:hypothetical protein